jgi:hypothetical protein
MKENGVICREKGTGLPKLFKNEREGIKLISERAGVTEADVKELAFFEEVDDEFIENEKAIAAGRIAKAEKAKKKAKERAKEGAKKAARG